jgi:enoyl-CoA hydratase/carnithine racemase
MTVRVEGDDGVVRLVLNRPGRRNALNAETIRGLADGIAEAAADPACRCVLITGEGDHFCAGRDLGEADRSTPLADIVAYDDLWADVIGGLRTMTVPSVSVVRGYAVAGGFTLAMACDFVLAEEGARFGALEMRGGFPAAVNTVVLSHLVGPRRSLELLLSADTFEARRLHEIGLINHLAKDADELAALEQQVVGRLAALDPLAVKLTKETHRAVARAPIAEALVTAKHLNALMMASGKIDEAAERLRREREEKKKG